MTREAKITDAAITTLAAEGMRGLTHRAVDRRAGLPEGSTSYYFRTRSALLTATVQRLAELDADEIPAPVSDLGDLASSLAASLVKWTTADRDRQLARYELTLEATRRAELRDALVRGGDTIRAMVAELLRAAGVPAPADRAHLLVACIDGLLFDQITGTGGGDPDVGDVASNIRQIVAAISA
ncbi:MAG TPA: TetR family transcriptional regulator [Candidatus Limnocylindrales bacterium]